MRDSMLFSALPLPSDGKKGFDNWFIPALEEFGYLLRGHLPFFINPVMDRLRVKFDNVDLGVIGTGGVVFLPKQGSREYKTTLPGKEQAGLKLSAILVNGGTEDVADVSTVCRSGFETIFIPSEGKAVKYSVEHKTTVVTWKDGCFMDIYYDTRNIIERTFSAIVLLESAIPGLSAAIENDDPRVFFEELAYAFQTKLKKGGRQYDLAEGIFGNWKSMENYPVLFGAAIDVRYFIKSLLGDSQYDAVLRLFRPHADRIETPLFYFYDHAVLEVCVYIMRHVDELMHFIGGTFGPKSVDVTPARYTRDSARSLSKQARIAMWYAELAKNNGAGVFCNACGKKLEFNDFAVDHIFPWSKGGKTEPYNLQVLCKDCNRKKGARIDQAREPEIMRRYRK